MGMILILPSRTAASTFARSAILSGVGMRHSLRVIISYHINRMYINAASKLSKRWKFLINTQSLS